MTPARPDTTARWFVRLVTVGCCLSAGWLVAKQGSNSFPVHDEWELLTTFVERPNYFEWAFAHHAEHRYPLAKLGWLGLLQASGYQFQVPMFASVGLLTAAAVLLQWAARRVRGAAHPLDALTAVLLLHWGHSFNLTMGYQIGFAWVAYAIAGWVWCGVNWNATRHPGWACGSAAYAASLALCGGFGLALTPGVVVWLGYLLVALARGGRWRTTAGLAALTVCVLAYTAWVVRTMPPVQPATIDPVTDTGRFLATAAAYLSGGLGYWYDRDGGPLRAGVTVLVAVVYAAAVGVGVWWVAAGRSGRRAAGVVVLGVLAGVLITSLLAARARGAAVVEARFTTPSAAGLAVAVATLAATARGRPWGAVAAAGGVLGALAGLATVNNEHALRLGFEIRDTHTGLKADLLAGTPPEVLAGRYAGTCGMRVDHPSRDRLNWFKRAGVGLFPLMADDPPFTAVPVEGGTAVPFRLGGGGADDGEVTLPTPPPRAFAMRWLSTCQLTTGWQRMTCRWTDPVSGEPRQSVAYPGLPNLPVWLVFTFDGRPTDLRVRSDGGAGTIRVDRVEWMVLPP